MTEVVWNIRDRTSERGMTSRALAILEAARQAAERAGLARIEVVAGKGSGHKSHWGGSEMDLVGYNADGSKWSREQRVAVAQGGREAGADRFGLYNMIRGIGRGTLHMGYSAPPSKEHPKGRPAAVWGADGRTGGAASRRFTDPFEKQFLASVASGKPLNLPAYAPATQTPQQAAIQALQAAVAPSAAKAAAGITPPELPRARPNVQLASDQRAQIDSSIAEKQRQIADYAMRALQAGQDPREITSVLERAGVLTPEAAPTRAPQIKDFSMVPTGWSGGRFDAPTPNVAANRALPDAAPKLRGEASTFPNSPIDFARVAAMGPKINDARIGFPSGTAGPGPAASSGSAEGKVALTPAAVNMAISSRWTDPIPAAETQSERIRREGGDLIAQPQVPITNASAQGALGPRTPFASAQAPMLNISDARFSGAPGASAALGFGGEAAASRPIPTVVADALARGAQQASASARASGRMPDTADIWTGPFNMDTSRVDKMQFPSANASVPVQVNTVPITLPSPATRVAASFPGKAKDDDVRTWPGPAPAPAPTPMAGVRMGTQPYGPPMPGATPVDRIAGAFDAAGGVRQLGGAPRVASNAPSVAPPPVPSVPQVPQTPRQGFEVRPFTDPPGSIDRAVRQAGRAGVMQALFSSPVEAAINRARSIVESGGTRKEAINGFWGGGQNSQSPQMAWAAANLFGQVARNQPIVAASEFSKSPQTTGGVPEWASNFNTFNSGGNTYVELPNGNIVKA